MIYELIPGKLITEQEYGIILLVRKLRPYGELKISMNQSAGDLSITLTNSERVIVDAKNVLQK